MNFEKLYFLLIFFSTLSILSCESPNYKTSQKDRSNLEKLIKEGNFKTLIDKIYPAEQSAFLIDSGLITAAKEHSANLQVRAESLRSAQHEMAILKAICIANMLMCEQGAQSRGDTRLLTSVSTQLSL